MFRNTVIAAVCGWLLAAGSAAADTAIQFVDLAPDHAPAASAQPEAVASKEGVALTETVSAPSAPQPLADAPVGLHYFDLSSGHPVEVRLPSSEVPPEVIVYANDEAADPWEDFNRDRFASHVFMQTKIIAPIEHAYIAVTPRFLRAALHNALTNLESPKIFVNDVLQADPGRAVGTAARFVINSTIGVGGVLDLATPIGIPFRDDDFGQTLANYGVGDAPYLLVPIVGPSNPRDITGKVVDVFLDPLKFVTVPGGILTSIGHAGASQLDAHSEHPDRLQTIIDTSTDPYAAERHDARERRQNEIDSGGRDDDD